MHQIRTHLESNVEIQDGSRGNHAGLLAAKKFESKEQVDFSIDNFVTRLINKATNKLSVISEPAVQAFWSSRS